MVLFFLILVPRARRFLVTWLGNEGLWKQPLPHVRKFLTSGRACAEVTNITAHAHNGFLSLTFPHQVPHRSFPSPEPLGLICNRPVALDTGGPRRTGGHFVYACVNMGCWRATEAFSVNCLHSVPAFAGCFLGLNDVYWVLRSTNMFFKVSRYFYDESEFIVPSLSPLRGQSFLS